MQCNSLATVKIRGAVWKVHVGEISIYGCSVGGTGLPFRQGEVIKMAIGSLAPIPGRVVQASFHVVGIEFDAPQHPSVAEHIATSH